MAAIFRSCSRLQLQINFVANVRSEKCGRIFSGFFTLNAPNSWLLIQPRNVLYHRNFHTAALLKKKKSKKGIGAQQLQFIIKPSDVEEYLNLENIKSGLEDCIQTLKDDYIRDFQVGNNMQAIEKIKIKLDEDVFELSEVAVINKSGQNLILIDLTDFPEAIRPTIKAFGNQAMYSIQNPGNDLVLKVAIPQVTAETRNKLAKEAKVRMNKTKDELKHFLNESEKELKTHEDVPEDALKLIRNQMQIFVKFYSVEAENIFKAKEKDILPK